MSIEAAELVLPNLRLSKPLRVGLPREYSVDGLSGAAKEASGGPLLCAYGLTSLSPSPARIRHGSAARRFSAKLGTPSWTSRSRAPSSPWPPTTSSRLQKRRGVPLSDTPPATL